MQPGTYAPPPPPAVPSEQVRPSKWWFVAAGLIAVVGIVLAVVWFVVGMMRFFDTIDEFQRVEVPGTSDVVLDDPGGYSVYHEYRGASGDDGFGRFAPEPSVTITDPSGDEVPLEPYTSEVSYDGSGHEGVALSTFDAEEAGTYTVEAEGDAGTEVAIGPGIGSGLVATIVGGFVIGGAGVLVGGIMAIVVGVRRSQNRRSLMGPTPPPGPPGGWGGAYPGYGPQPGYGGYPPAPATPGYGSYGGSPQATPSGPGYGPPQGPGYGPPPNPGDMRPSSGPGYGPPPNPGDQRPPSVPVDGPAAGPAGGQPPSSPGHGEPPSQDAPPQDAPPQDAPPSGPYPPPAPPRP